MKKSDASSQIEKDANKVLSDLANEYEVIVSWSCVASAASYFLFVLSFIWMSRDLENRLILWEYFAIRIV